MRSSKKPRKTNEENSKLSRIDRRIPGLGRLALRTGRMSSAAHAELDYFIGRAAQEGHIEQLRMLKDGEITKTEFLIAARKNQIPALRASPLVRPLVDQWLATPGLRESSRQRYRQSWNFIFATLGPNACLRDLSQDWWPTFLQSRGTLSTSTLNRDRAALLAFRSWARSCGHSVPDFTHKKFREEPVQSRILTADERERLIEKCRPDRYLFFWTLLETGMRQGEAINLRTADVALDSPSVTVLSRPGAKSKGKVRHIPISEELAQALHLQGTTNANQRVFPITRSTAQDWWQELRDRLGTRDVTLHGLRATFITTGLDSGVPATEVQKLAGHSSLAMTERYYRNRATTRASAERIREALGLVKARAESGEFAISSTTPPSPGFAQVG